LVSPVIVLAAIFRHTGAISGINLVLSGFQKNSFLGVFGFGRITKLTEHQPRGFLDTKKKSAANVETTLRMPSPATNLAHHAKVALPPHERARAAARAGASSVTPNESTSQTSQNQTGTQAILSVNKARRTTVPIGITARKTMVTENNAVRIHKAFSRRKSKLKKFFILFRKRNSTKTCDGVVVFIYRWLILGTVFFPALGSIGNAGYASGSVHGGIARRIETMAWKRDGDSRYRHW
jgi:hypothetical protein